MWSRRLRHAGGRAAADAACVAWRRFSTPAVQVFAKSGFDDERDATTAPLARATQKATVVVAMSGGVDSSVAAYLLCQQGYRVVGVHMANWDARDEGGPAACAHDRDFEDVRTVCRQLGIPALQVNLVKEYWHDVFAPSLDVYSRGLTPNPDALCNRAIKMGAFRDHARRRLGADFIAFGHYARLLHPPPETPPLERLPPQESLSLLRGSSPSLPVESGPPNDTLSSRGINVKVLPDPLAAPLQPPPPRLLAGVDPVKDQSYFLAAVPGEQLRNILFPVGHLRKADVRRIAADAGLATAAKRESMGLCFVGRRRRFGAFLSEYLQLRPGHFVAAAGVSIEDVESVNGVGACGGSDGSNDSINSGGGGGGGRRGVSGSMGDGNGGNGVNSVSDGVNIGNGGNGGGNGGSGGNGGGVSLGPHAGFELYTIGQKARIPNAVQKWFVVGKMPSEGAVVVAPGADHPALFCPALHARRADFSWVAGAPPPALAAGLPLACRCKVRYRQGTEACVVSADGGENGEEFWRVDFAEPARAIAPQQLLALYLGEECLGGGPIESAVYG